MKFLQQITASVQKFGDINIKSDPCNFSILKRINKTVTLRKRINTKCSYVYGCSLLPGDRMVFSSYTDNTISVLTYDGSKDFEIKNIGPTFDVVFIGDDSIAVTSGESNQINIIDLKKHKVKKSITVDSYTSGVVYKDGHLMYCAREKGIQMISLNDETITNVNNTKFPDVAYVTTFDDKLLYTNWDNDSVTCCDYHGNLLWTFCDKSVLLSTCGISVDNDGNMYVAGNNTHNVVVISPNGQICRQLLSVKDGLMYPHALHYDTSTDELLVANTSK